MIISSDIRRKLRKNCFLHNRKDGNERQSFRFITEAPLITYYKNLMDMMERAGFAKVFVGIETPYKSCLMECNKLITRDEIFWIA